MASILLPHRWICNGHGINFDAKDEKWLQFGATSKTKEFFKGVNFLAFSLPTK